MYSNVRSFRVKSPKETENLNPTVSDFNETWYTCCLGTHSTKSKMLGQSDQWCGIYGPPNFESFSKNGCGCQPLNPHISGTSYPIQCIHKTGIDGHLFISSRHFFDMYMSKECLDDTKYAFVVLCIAGLHFKIYIVAELKILPL